MRHTSRSRFEILGFREFDSEAAIKFLDQHCPTVITGPVIIEKYRIRRPILECGLSPCAFAGLAIRVDAYGWTAVG